MKIKTNILNIPSIGEFLIILVFAIIPLLFNLPFRINIYLSWEGAYRLYLGQVPYRDFGLPMGFGFWLIPALFFKLFGPYFLSLIKAQVFINILSGIAFRSILCTFKIKQEHRIILILLYCLSYSFLNFWPWYNHSVIVFLIISSAFLLKALISDSINFKSISIIIIGSFFLFLSIFTKQDAGILGLIIYIILFFVSAISERNPIKLLIFTISLLLITTGVLLPFIKYDFTYWFNIGQYPHYSRMSLYDILNSFFNESKWIRFYIICITIIIIKKFLLPKTKYLSENKYFILFTLGILVLAIIYQVTSYVPPNNNIFFHSFAITFIISSIDFKIPLKTKLVYPIIFISVFIFWSENYWKYTERILSRYTHINNNVDFNKVSINTWSIKKDDKTKKQIKWVLTDIKSLENVYIPSDTYEGIKRLKNLEIFKTKNDPNVLNMSELTFLAYEFNYELPVKGSPLWYHKGVCLFDRELDVIRNNIINGTYEIVLFEYLEGLNNFYPFEIRDLLKSKYKMIDSFLAPRSDGGRSPIEVYVPI